MTIPCRACRPIHGCGACPGSGISRRSFLAAAAGAFIPIGTANPSNRQQPINQPLRVQPVLTYRIYPKREGTSYRPWGGLITEQDVSQEKERIGRELQAMSVANPNIQFLPLETASTPEEATKLRARKQDVTLMYAASGENNVLEALTDWQGWNLMFLRHRSGPVYLWYEIAHPRFLRRGQDGFVQPGIGVRDIVVDSQPELLGKMSGLHGLKNTFGKKILAIGGPGGWGSGARRAPEIARREWKLDIQTVTYDDLDARIKKARLDDARLKRCNAQAADYIRGRGVKVETSREFIDRAFLLTEVFRDFMDEAQTDAITVGACMGTIMKVSETTACLTLSILNDEGYMAFCESDFVVIPSGILLRYISGRPMFFNDPTHPHDGLVTLAHCTAPRKMDGISAEPVRLLTHFESDYGVAPKVEMRKGQKVTNLIPDFGNRQWVGFEAEIVDSPFLAICRSQIDVKFQGDTESLLERMKGFHWMTCYGNYLRETRYALGKLGVEMQGV